MMSVWFFLLNTIDKTIFLKEDRGTLKISYKDIINKTICPH